MSVPTSFPSITSKYALPLLFAGQAQKEFSINQALTIIDAMMMPSVSATLASPPDGIEDGESFRISASASGAWLGHDDEVAVRIGGAWQFLRAYDGLTIFDQADGMFWHFNSGWKNADEPAAPTGGTVIDVEARAALTDLIQALRNLGIFPDPE